MNIQEAKHSPKGTEYEHWDFKCWDSNWHKILNSVLCWNANIRKIKKTKLSDSTFVMPECTRAAVCVLVNLKEPLIRVVYDQYICPCSSLLVEQNDWCESCYYNTRPVAETRTLGWDFNHWSYDHQLQLHLPPNLLYFTDYTTSYFQPLSVKWKKLS